MAAALRFADVEPELDADVRLLELADDRVLLADDRVLLADARLFAVEARPLLADDRLDPLALLDLPPELPLFRRSAISVPL